MPTDVKNEVVKSVAMQTPRDNRPSLTKAYGVDMSLLGVINNECK